MPSVTGVLETALYVEDLPRSMEFYQTVFGFAVMGADERICALSVAGRQVLLLLKKGASTQPHRSAGGVIPPSDASGQMHVAFSVPGGELERWEHWLREKGVSIESKVNWERGGQSLYFRDPDGHLLELATPGTWSLY